jgi:hypothetical protein
MGNRLRTAEQSARRETAMAKVTLSTLVAVSSAPRDPRLQAEHYRRHLTDAHRTIETLQGRIAELERDRDKAKAASDYAFSLSVTKSAANDAVISAFRLAREKAALLMEGTDGEPTAQSEAIRAIPDPKPKWR